VRAIHSMAPIPSTFDAFRVVRDYRSVAEEHGVRIPDAYGEALEVADRIVLMNRGRIEQIGSPREIYDEPKTSFAYSFIGNVNEFRGKVEGANVRIGQDLLPHVSSHLHDGQPVVAYARPHDTEIVTDVARGEGIAAKVNRILTSGGVARVELVANGADRAGRTDYFEVEVQSDDLAALGLTTGQKVRLKSRRLSLFEQNQ